MIPVVTIDGPSGSGKGTVSQRIAQFLGWHYLDSGALYRVLGLAATQHEVAFDNPQALVVLAAHLDVQFITTDSSNAINVILEGENVTDAIRAEGCGRAASQLGALPEVRTALLARQRAFREAPGLITDGRDMGTVIFPDATVKIFLVANLEARAQRRYNQLINKGIHATLDQILADLAERDKRDRERAVAPLKPAPDATVVDTTDLSIEQVVEQILGLIQTNIS